MRLTSVRKWLGVALCLAAGTALAQSLSWRQLPGSANDIGVGPTGEVWVIGTDCDGGNNCGIYHWVNGNWVKAPGAARRITVGPSGPYVTNGAGGIYKWNGSSWDQLPGAAWDIGAGANGQVWVIGTNAEVGGYGIYKWVGNNWSKIPGSAVKIAVDPQGNAWVTTSGKAIFRYNGSAFVQMPGAANDVGIGADGTVYVVGTDGGVYKWNGSNWDKKEGVLAEIAVDQSGNPWGVNPNKQIWASTAGNVPSLTVSPAPAQGDVTAFYKSNSQYAGVSCKAGSKPACSKTYPAGTVLTIQSFDINTGYVFQGWTGACQGQPASGCTVTIDKAVTVSATFSSVGTLTGTVTKPTGGTILGNYVSCGDAGGPCSGPITSGQNAVYDAVPTAGYVFDAWGGDCAGKTGQCSVLANKNLNVSATFRFVGAATLSVSPAPTGGDVTVFYVNSGLPGIPTGGYAGVSCKAGSKPACSKSYTKGTKFTVGTYDLDSGMRFTGWTGACSGQPAGNCTLTLDSDKSIGATFAR